MTSTNPLLIADNEARASALDISRSFIVQAPAGSGKTELLIQRYLTLLASVDFPEEVIAITFTRKAAAEMQVRVLNGLRTAKTAVEPDAAHEKLTFKLARKVLDRSDELSWSLLANPRRMRIQTLDSLNASIARSQPITADGTASRVIVGSELQRMLTAAATATLDWLAEASGYQQAPTDVLLHVDNNTALYSAYLSQMLATRDQWLPFIGSGHLSGAEDQVLRQQFESNLRATVVEHLSELRVHLSDVRYADLVGLCDFAAQQLDGQASSAISDLAGMTELPAATPEQMHLWAGIADMLMTQKGQFRKKVDKRQGFPADNKERKAAVHALLAEMAVDDRLAALLFGVQTLPPVTYLDEQWNVLLALFRLLPLAVSELKRLFSEKGATDHIEVAMTADAALGTPEEPGDIALLLDYRVRHLLVDEMQDTSFAQYRMIEMLSAGWEQGDGRSLFCVGDPMQSIYRFRNAEVGQFLLAQSFGVGSIKLEPLLLRQNFRSGSRLVEWFNATFPGVMAASDDAARGAVAYREALPAQHLAGQGECVTHPVFGADARTEARRGCEVIAATLAANADDDMAVLVRGRTQLPFLLAELRDAGIAYQAIEIDRLTDLPEIIDILALTRAAAHAGDRIAWLAVLRGPWIGLDWSDLHILVRNDRASNVWQLLHDNERLGQLSASGRQAIARAMPSLAKLTDPRRSTTLRETVEEIWFQLGGAAMLDSEHAVENIYRFLDVLSEQEIAGTLTDVGELESILDMERVSSTEVARLQIMTMHRAKGLQFDHVLLYGLGRQPGKGDRRVLSWFDVATQDGDERKIISPVGPRTELANDAIHRYIELTEAAKDRHEQSRLLYVACTRAKKSLHLLGNTAISSDGEIMRAARSDSLLHLLWPSLAGDFEHAFGHARHLTPADSEDVFVEPILRRFQSPWELPEALMPPTLLAADRPDATSNEVEFYWVGSEARVAGTLTHRWLHKLAANGLPSDLGSDDFTALASFDTTTRRWLSETGYRDEAATLVCARVREAVKASLDDERGRWILGGEGHAELALSGQLDGKAVSVVIDRVRVDDDGTHWIIDYKTSAHEGGNLDGFLRVEEDRYRPQLERYAELYAAWADTPVRCALYFPLLKVFREVALHSYKLEPQSPAS